jgi:hypothetical protein
MAGVTQTDVGRFDGPEVIVVLKELEDVEQRYNGAGKIDGRKVEHDCLTKKRAIVPGRVDARQGEAPDGAKKNEAAIRFKRRRAYAR